MKITEISVNRPVTVLMITLIILLLGYISYTLIPIDLMPDVTYPALTIRTIYSDVGAEEIENTITKPIEAAVAAIADIEHISSVSSEGSSRITLNFSWDKDLESATNDVRERLDRIRGALPDEAEDPILFKFDLSAFPVMILGVESKMNINDLQEYLENQIQYRFERIPGVASADIHGGYKKEIQILIDKEKIEQFNIPLSTIVSSIKENNTNQSAGSIKHGFHDIVIRLKNEYENISDIESRVVTVINNIPILVKDIASVKFTTEKVRQITLVNAQPGVRMAISKQSGSNTVKVANAIQNEIEKINSDYDYIKIFPIIDTSEYIKNAINSVKSAAIFGAILAAFVLLFFLRNIRSTIIISVAIPISIIATFILIYNGGFTLNIMSFGGLALGIGMLLDNSIVVLENTYRHIAEEKIDRRVGAIIGTQEVGMAILASTLTTIAVFLPMLFISGMAGIMFKQIAMVVTFSLICSFVVSITIVPMLSSRYLKIYKNNVEDAKTITMRIFSSTEKIFNYIDEQYSLFLKWNLSHKKIVVLIAALFLLSSLYLVRFVGMEFMSSTDEGEIRINVDASVGTNIDVSYERIQLIEEIIKYEIPELDNSTTNLGSGGYGPGGGGGHTANIRLRLIKQKDRERSTSDVIEDLNKKLQLVEGVRVRIRSGSGIMMMRTTTSGSGDKIAIEIRGHNLETGRTLTLDLKNKIENIDGITDANISREESRPEENIKIDYFKAARLGLKISDINTLMNIGLSGQTVTYYRYDGKEFNIVVKYQDADNYSIQDLLNFHIPLPEGKTQLSNFISVVSGEGPVSIERLDQERIITLDVNFENRDLNSVVADIRKVISVTPIPDNFSITIGGEFEEQQKSFKEMLFVLILAIVLVYMVMAAQFESFIDPFIVLFSVPLAVIGVILTLILTDTLFNVQGFIGLIMLAGIVVNNAIILVDYTNLLRRKNKLDLISAVILAGRRRLRPILMTTLTTVLGLMPLAVGLGEGSELQIPLARVVCGGLLSSSFITLILIPVLYVIFENRILKFNKK